MTRTSIAEEHFTNNNKNNGDWNEKRDQINRKIANVHSLSGIFKWYKGNYCMINEPCNLAE
jgi:hypothetical protein